MISSCLMLIFLNFLFFCRGKVLELSLWLDMLGLTACLTSWSTSLSTMDSASTSSVLVSITCDFFFPGFFTVEKNIFSGTFTKLKVPVYWQHFDSQTISVQWALGSITSQVILSISRPYFVVVAYYRRVKLCYYDQSLRGIVTLKK